LTCPDRPVLSDRHESPDAIVGTVRRRSGDLFAQRR
jgi:hypothetical protein